MNIELFTSGFSSSEDELSFSSVFSVSVRVSVSFLGSVTVSFLALKYSSSRGRRGGRERGGRRGERGRRRRRGEREEGGERKEEGEGEREEGEEEREEGEGEQRVEEERGERESREGKWRISKRMAANKYYPESVTSNNWTHD